LNKASVRKHRGFFYNDFFKRAVKKLELHDCALRWWFLSSKALRTKQKVVEPFAAVAD